MDFLKKLPETEYEFSVDVIGNTTKIRYQGDFVGAIPTNRMQSSVKRKEAALNSGLESEVTKRSLGMAYDPILDLHYKIAYLTHILKSSPKFFIESNYGEKLIGDINLIDEIYTQVLKLENDWYEKIWPTEEKNDTKSE
jgi:hypothetical protein